MTTLIVSNSINLSESIQRFMHFGSTTNHSYNLANFQQFENFWISNLEQVETMVIDIYEEKEEQLVSSGLMHGNFFWDQDKKLIWFYTRGGLVDNNLARLMPPNAFRLPSQLNAFLTWLKSPVPVPYELLQIQSYFISQSITNTHH